MSLDSSDPAPRLPADAAAALRERVALQEASDARATVLLKRVVIVACLSLPVWIGFVVFSFRG